MSFAPLKKGVSMMKSVYKTFVAWFVSFSVIASALAGAFAVNLKKASAKPSNTIYTWSQLADLVYELYPNNEIIEAWFDHFSGTGTTNNALDFDIFSDNQYLVLVALGSESEEIAITVWQWSPSFLDYYHDDGWQISNDIIVASPASGYVFNRLGYFYSDLSHEYTVDQTLRSYNLYAPLSNQAFSFGATWQVFDNHLTVFPNTMTFYNANYTILTSRPIYTPNSSVIDYESTLVGAPVSAYNNVCFSYGQQYYFTFSDQSILQTFVSEQSSNVVPITFSKGNQQYTFNYSMDELVYTGRTNVSGVTNVGSGGVLAWNLTPMINQWYFDSIIHSHVEPAGVYRNYFANNETYISWAPATDPWSTYYDYLDKLLDLTENPNHITPNNPPSYVTNNVYTSYKSISVAGGSKYDCGNILLNEIPDVPFDTILVCSSKLFDDIGNHVDLLNVNTSTTEFINYLSPYLLYSIDLIVVLTDNDFESVLQGQPDHPDHFVNWNPYSWNVGVVSGPHGYFYYTSPSIRDATVDDVSGFAFVTERYLQKCQNYMLSDGIEHLYNGLNDITSNQDSIISAIVNGAGAVYTSLQVCFGKIEDIYNLLFDLKLSDKFNSIIDKLDKIVDNTTIEGEENSFWIAPLYNFIKLFEPSESDYTSSISEIVSTLDELPDIPSITPVAIPTSQIFLPGE